jgi:hypothetical protein
MLSNMLSDATCKNLGKRRGKRERIAGHSIRRFGFRRQLPSRFC